jgi:hypothetical protein
MCTNGDEEEPHRYIDYEHRKTNGDGAGGRRLKEVGQEGLA